MSKRARKSTFNQTKPAKRSKVPVEYLARLERSATIVLEKDKVTAVELTDLRLTSFAMTLYDDGFAKTVSQLTDTLHSYGRKMLFDQALSLYGVLRFGRISMPRDLCKHLIRTWAFVAIAADERLIALFQAKAERMARHIHRTFFERQPGFSGHPTAPITFPTLAAKLMKL